MKYPLSQQIIDLLHAPLEGYLLADSVELHEGGTVLDIGCGSGIIALSLAVKYPLCTQICGIEIYRPHLESANSALQELKCTDEQIAPASFINGDIRRYPLIPHSFDVIVSNPPFFASGSGKPSPNPSKNIAHTENTLSLHDLLDCVHQLLKPNGRFMMVYSLARLKEVKKYCHQTGLVITHQQEYSEARKSSGGIMVLEIKQDA